MFKIGELAKICNVSTQTLRFYDKIGILCPEKIDKYTSYRYYSDTQIETLKLIIRLKKLGFDLSEIKVILSLKEKERIALYKKKINHLKKESKVKDINISELEKLCNGKINTDEAQCQSLIKRLSQLDFINDDNAIGKWELIGKCKAVYSDTEILISKSNIITAGCENPKSLFFLPGGAFYWVYGWTKGILYRISGYSTKIISNEYKMFKIKSITYMIIYWKDSENTDEPYPILYKKIDSKHYTDKETRIFNDDTDIPFLPDNSLIGRWSACAIVKNIDDFSPNNMYNSKDLFYTGLNVTKRGICLKETRSKNLLLSYSKGVIISTATETVEHYVIKRINGDEYLFLEHKSGDYIYGGKINVYYVFKRSK